MRRQGAGRAPFATAVDFLRAKRHAECECPAREGTVCGEWRREEFGELSEALCERCVNSDDLQQLIAQFEECKLPGQLLQVKNQLVPIFCSNFAQLARAVLLVHVRLSQLKASSSAGRISSRCM